MSAKRGVETAPRSTSPRKKQQPGYMKLLSSKEPVATIKRTKGLHVPNEPFDKLEVETFREVNKTRKV